MIGFRVIVTGLESSGTKWVTELLGRHPGVREVIHTSIPEYLMRHVDIKTRWPELNGADHVVWMFRDETCRLASVKRLEYDADRSPEFVPPQLYANCSRLYRGIRSPITLISYEGLVGPVGKLVFDYLLVQMRLDPQAFPWETFDPKDANRKSFGIKLDNPSK